MINDLPYIKSVQNIISVIIAPPIGNEFILQLEASSFTIAMYLLIPYKAE